MSDIEAKISCWNIVTYLRISSEKFHQTKTKVWKWKIYNMSDPWSLNQPIPYMWHLQLTIYIPTAVKLLIG